ncbi:hypothetical protein F895_01968 [Acinetobacter sp. CIP 64.2]|nr:hypothetical protein F895_01968 [Acinetobacter sp. CIP 64.2]
MFQFIQQQQDLAVLLKQMEQCSVYALDTEFIKVDTLYRLCCTNRRKVELF